MDSDDEDYVFVGTAIETEEDTISRKKKAVAQASGQLRTLVPWKQEVRDEEGRRRFHGAFTGGYSAGYYNTVGSKEGWTPQSFTSSRKNRADVKQQDISSFLDDDEKAEMEGKMLGTASQFDTFGFTMAEHARNQAEKENKQRPAPIPGPIPDEIVLPATDSIGEKLLRKMGWRHGRSLKDSLSKSLHDARREGRKAALAFSSHDASVQNDSSEKNASDFITEHSVNEVDKSSHVTPVYVRQPKQDMHGLGYDPYKHAPEFRDRKNSSLASNKGVGNRKPYSVKDDLLSSRSGRVAPGFSIGALEELDVEDEDVYSSGYNFEETYVQEEVEEPSILAIENQEKSIQKEQGRFPRFKTASNSRHQLERFSPPLIPEGFVPHHKFQAPLPDKTQVSSSPPTEVPPPGDINCKMTIDGVASLVARCGKIFEDLLKEKNQSDPLFSFLSGGSGFEYYARKLWEEQQKRHGQPKLLPEEKALSVKQKMTAEGRGKALGEKPLERSSTEPSSGIPAADNSQFNLADTFTTPESLNQLFETAKPFKDDPAKQDRFEQFLRAKYQGGLRSTGSSGASNMSEAARARERLDFEAAAETIEKSKRVDKGKVSAQLMDFTMNSRLQFTSAGVEEKSSKAEELASKKLYPKREEFQWRPAPLLCKRYDIMDPFMGKPPAAPRIRSKMDSLIFTPDSAKSTKTEDVGVSSQSGLSVEAENDVAVEVENVERPVDLYKAIFSDDSDAEEEASVPNQAADPQKKIEAATATFSRLVAGDFLESLGKELGMELPPDLPLPTGQTKLPAGDTTPTPDTFNGSNKKEEVKPNEGPHPNEPPKETGIDKLDNPEAVVDKKVKSSSGRRYYDSASSSSEDERSKKKSKRLDKSEVMDRKGSSSWRHYDDEMSSEDERRRKKSRRRRQRSSSPGSEKRSRDRRRRRKHESSSKRSRADSPGGYRSRDKERSERKTKHRDRD